MDDTISSSVKLGVSIILVSALVATILSLMVTSQSILNAGQTSFQSGIDQIMAQEYEPYNGRTLSGIDVQSALALFGSRDIALIVQTKACQDRSPAIAGFNYGALLGTKGGVAQLGTPETGGGQGTQIAIPSNSSDFCETTGVSYYTGYLYIKSNGLCAYNGDTLGTTARGDDEYILQTAKFISYLIKDNTGAIVGIYFVQTD